RDNRAKIHGTAGVDGQRAEQVGFILEEPHIGFTGAGQHFPVEPAQVFPLRVFAIVDEFPGTPQLPRRMPATVCPLDTMPGREPHVREREQRVHVQEAAGSTGGGHWELSVDSGQWPVVSCRLWTHRSQSSARDPQLSTVHCPPTSSFHIRDELL